MSDVAGSDEKYHGSLISVRVQPVEVAPGRTVPFEIVEHPDAVAIVALREERPDDQTAEPLVALVRQHRPAVDCELWEIPAGLVEPDERGEPQRTAARELREETGATAAHWQLLAREYPSPGFSTESIAIYLATGVELAAGAGPMDTDEITEVRWVPFSEALAMCGSGAIQDGKTLLGLMLARETLTISPAALGGAPTMPLDPTNAPFPRSARYRDPADIALEGREDETSAMPGAETRDTSLKLQDMLLEEFNYASVTAYQAMEDRARMFNLYLIVIGVVASGLGALFQFGNGKSVYTLPLSVIALVIAGLLGAVFFVKLIRVRQAYNGSTLAMNVVKEFYLIQFAKSMPQAKYAFWWRLNSLPKGERFGSITFVVSATVAVLNGLCFGGAAFIAYQEWLRGSLSFLPDAVQPFLVAGIVAVVLTLVHIPYFRYATNNEKGIASAQKHLAQMRAELGVSEQDITVPR